MQDFRTILRLHIGRRYRTDTEFADALGVGRAHVSHVLSGRKPLSLKQIDAWADALGLEGQDRAEFKFAVEVANSPASIHDRIVQAETIVARMERELAAMRENQLKLLARLRGLRARRGKRPSDR